MTQAALYSGTAWCLGDNVSTDEILPGRYMAVSDHDLLGRHALAGIDEFLAAAIGPGDILVAGSNFGTGSSRESASRALRYAGFAAVVAESYARIFYRNCINTGLPVFWVPGARQLIVQGDVVVIDATGGRITNTTRHEEMVCQAMPDFVLRIVQEGGLAAYAKSRLGRSLVPTEAEEN